MNFLKNWNHFQKHLHKLAGSRTCIRNHVSSFLACTLVLWHIGFIVPVFRLGGKSWKEKYYRNFLSSVRRCLAFILNITHITAPQPTSTNNFKFLEEGFSELYVSSVTESYCCCICYLEVLKFSWIHIHTYYTPLTIHSNTWHF